MDLDIQKKKPQHHSWWIVEFRNVWSEKRCSSFPLSFIYLETDIKQILSRNNTREKPLRWELENVLWEVVADCCSKATFYNPLSSSFGCLECICMYGECKSLAGFYMAGPSVTWYLNNSQELTVEWIWICCCFVSFHITLFHSVANIL